MIRYCLAPLALLAAPVHAGALADLAAIDTAVAAFAGNDFDSGFVDEFHE